MFAFANAFGSPGEFNQTQFAIEAFKKGALQPNWKKFAHASRTALRTAPGLPEGKTLGELPIMEQTQKKKTAKPYSPEFRERAVRLVLEHRDEYQSEAAALTAIAGKLGCAPDSVRV